MKIKPISLICIFCILGAIFIAYLPLFNKLKEVIVGWGQYYIPALDLSTALSRWHQFPFISYLFGGGYPVLGDIQSWILSPFAIFIALFGPFNGVRLIVFSYMIIGVLGVYYFSRSILNYNYIAAIFSSLIFILSSWFAYRIIDSDLYYLCICFMPWVFAFFIKSFATTKYLLLSSMALSSFINFGGLNFFIICVFLALYCFFMTFHTIVKKNIQVFRPFLNFAIVVMLAILLSAIKLFPMAELIKSRNNVSFHASTKVEQAYGAIECDQSGRAIETLAQRCFTLNKLYNALFKKDFPEQQNLSVYFGIIPAIFFLISLITYPKKMMIYFFLLLVFVAFMFGPNSPIDVFKPLWNINDFTRALSKPDKYFLPYIIFLIAVISGQACSLDAMAGGKKKHILSGIICLFALFGIFDIFNLHHSIIGRLRYKNLTVLPIKSPDNFFQVKFYMRPDEISWLNAKENDDFWFFPLFQQNIGIVNFFPLVSIDTFATPKYIINKERGDLVYNNIENFAKIESLLPINPPYRGEVYFLRPENFSELILFSHNKITMMVEMASPDKLIINQNFRNGWLVNKGIVRECEGLLSVVFDKPFNGKVELEYISYSFLLGLGVTCLTLISSLFFIRKLK